MKKDKVYKDWEDSILIKHIWVLFLVIPYSVNNFYVLMGFMNVFAITSALFGCAICSDSRYRNILLHISAYAGLSFIIVVIKMIIILITHKREMI